VARLTQNYHAPVRLDHDRSTPAAPPNAIPRSKTDQVLKVWRQVDESMRALEWQSSRNRKLVGRRRRIIVNRRRRIVVNRHHRSARVIRAPIRAGSRGDFEAVPNRPGCRRSLPKTTNKNRGQECRRLLVHSCSHAPECTSLVRPLMLCRRASIPLSVLPGSTELSSSRTPVRHICNTRFLLRLKFTTMNRGSIGTRTSPIQVHSSPWPARSTRYLAADLSTKVS